MNSSIEYSPKGRLLGLDIGKKKVGIAISDATLSLARAIKMVPFRELRYEILCFKESTPDLFGLVIGLPVSKSGDAAKEIKKVAKALEEEFQLQVFFEDERLTSWEAREILKEAGYKPDKIKELEDQTAAQLILQSYLNNLAERKE